MDFEKFKISDFLLGFSSEPEGNSLFLVVVNSKHMLVCTTIVLNDLLEQVDHGKS